MVVQANFIEVSSTRLVTDILMDYLRSQFVQANPIRKRFTAKVFFFISISVFSHFGNLRSVDHPSPARLEREWSVDVADGESLSIHRAYRAAKQLGIVSGQLGDVASDGAAVVHGTLLVDLSDLLREVLELGDDHLVREDVRE